MCGKVTLCIFCLLLVSFSLITICHFVAFLSFHSYLKHVTKDIESSPNLMNNGVRGVFASISKNMFLLILFMLQHSLQASGKVKAYIQSWGWKVIERLLYNCATCICLQILMFYWQPIPNVIFWEVSTQNNAVMWWFFTIIHITCWLLMYNSFMIMDVAEFLGARQVYYDCKDWLAPEAYKSFRLNRLYSHVRHITYSPLIVVLFIHPIMYLDRLIIAYVFIIYMITRFKVDEEDYEYSQEMLRTKIAVMNMSRFAPPNYFFSG